ncbi:MAG: hypothetical protein HOJ64_00365 [Euryarchaeota archaeon]|nr:hypothetical protein [Euryarchaeota archaeon]MBT4392374.1 hypothetical protein [Euryarchaeota archaeon]MBT4802320.1 hypothetical protein [Euryarchaeota archaeon]MBT5613310.1 hypothetical protein [Euryarchaeota archaeon]MBT6684626.1 hypothetical protein [Euryarchaeota archaeon]
MARTDSMIWFILGFAQLIFANLNYGEGILQTLEFFLNVTGGSSIMVGLYVLLFMAKHSQDFSDAYTKYEKSEVIRSDEGNLVITDGDSVVAKGMGIIVPAIISVFAAIYWLSTI